MDLLAPGENIATRDAQGRVVRVSGTSFAAPLVAGAAALLLSEQPSATVAQLVDALLCGARPSDEIAGKVVAGYLDIARSLQCELSPGK